jgi:hypothetical protein
LDESEPAGDVRAAGEGYPDEELSPDNFPRFPWMGGRPPVPGMRTVGAQLGLARLLLDNKKTSTKTLYSSSPPPAQRVMRDMLCLVNPEGVVNTKRLAEFRKEVNERADAVDKHTRELRKRINLPSQPNLIHDVFFHDLLTSSASNPSWDVDVHARSFDVFRKSEVARANNTKERLQRKLDKLEVADQLPLSRIVRKFRKKRSKGLQLRSPKLGVGRKFLMTEIRPQIQRRVSAVSYREPEHRDRAQMAAAQGFAAVG